jgi:hypothetical protein
MLEACIQDLVPTHRVYGIVARRFLSYLQTHFPQVRRLSDLHRDPHLLAWIHCLSTQTQPLSDSTRAALPEHGRTPRRSCQNRGNP